MEHVVQAVTESGIFSMLRKANDLASMFNIMKQSVKEISEYHNISLLGNLYAYSSLIAEGNNMIMDDQAKVVKLKEFFSIILLYFIMIGVSSITIFVEVLLKL